MPVISVPYIKSGCQNPPQRLKRGIAESVYFEFFSPTGALTDPTGGKVTFRDQYGVVIVDFSGISLLDKDLIKESIGRYYYSVQLKVEETTEIIYALPYGTISGKPARLDVPIAILVMDADEVPSIENYCTVEGVSSFTGRDYTTNSQPTRNQVQEMIDFICGQINDYLRYQYDTPITGERALFQLKIIAKLGTAAMAEKSVPRGREASATAWKKEYDQYLKEIKAGTLPLTTTSNEGAQIAEPNMSNIIGGLGTDTAIEDEDKENFFDVSDVW